MAHESVNGDQETKRKDRQFVVFKLGEECYGVEILQVQTIERMLELTSIPDAPDFVEGVTNLRGEVIPVVDLRKRFGLPDVEQTDQTRIITVKIQDMQIGMIVDEASEVVKVSEGAIEPPPTIVGELKSTYLEGVAKLENRLLVIIDLCKVFQEEEISSLQEIET